MAESLESLRFLFVTGKGGVGKSTVAATLGHRLSARGKRVLIAVPAGSRALEHVLGHSLGSEPTPLGTRLWGMKIDPDESMREYAAHAMGSPELARLVLKGQVAKGFLHGVPGLAAWALLGKAWYATTVAKDGPPLAGAPYDTVIFDGFATGDGTEMLRIPRTVAELAPPGKLKKDALDCYELLRDPRRSAVLLVALAEMMPATETAELAESIRATLGYPLGAVVVNQWEDFAWAASDRERILKSDIAAGSAWSFPRDLAEREEQREAALAVLKGIGVPCLRLPKALPEPVGAARLLELGSALEVW